MGGIFFHSQNDFPLCQNAGVKVILAGGKIILAGGKITLAGGKIIWAVNSKYHYY